MVKENIFVFAACVKTFVSKCKVFWGKCESFANKCNVSWGHAKLALEQFSGDAKVDTNFLGENVKVVKKLSFAKFLAQTNFFASEQHLRGIQKCCEGNAKDL